MKKHEIKVGGLYAAKVSGKITNVQVTAIREVFNHRDESRTVYDVTNLVTGRNLTFRSAMRFRRAIERWKTSERIPDVDKNMVVY